MSVMCKPEVFSPYSEAKDLGAINIECGINWSYATFTDESAIAVFVSRCSQHGYRTRNEGIDSKGNFVVQYHHYAS